MKFEREHSNVGKALTYNEEAKLLAACESNVLLHTVVSLALNTALRKNEIRILRWDQIDLFKRTLIVGRAKTEGGSGRVVPLNIIAYGALVRWAGKFPNAKPRDFVFPSCENARIDTKRPDASRIDVSRPIMSWRTAWRRALADAGLEIRFHDLRHCCVTKLAESQVSEQTLMAIAGHMSRAMVEHYSHIRMAAKRAAVEGIARQAQAADFETGVNQNVHQVSRTPSDIPRI